VHGHHLARKLGIRRLLVPPEAGVASALGMLAAPPRVDRVASLGRRLDACTAEGLAEAFGSLEREAQAVLAGGGWERDVPAAARMVDARCVGQGAHMPVPLPPTPWPDGDGAVRGLIKEAFGVAYAARYGRPPPAVPVELVHARIVLRGARGDAAHAATIPDAPAPEAPRRRRIVIGPTAHDAAIHRRSALPAGFLGHGPALVEEAGSTLVVGPGSRFSVLPSGNLLVELA
jgi:N-methylhydantoinase A